MSAEQLIPFVITQAVMAIPVFMCVALLCGAADYGVFFCLPVGETVLDGQTGFLGVLDNLQLWSTAGSISSWINRGWPELLLWLAVCLPARRQAGNE